MHPDKFRVGRAPKARADRYSKRLIRSREVLPVDWTEDPGPVPVPVVDPAHVREANLHALADARAGRDWRQSGCVCVWCKGLRNELARVERGGNLLGAGRLLDGILLGSEDQPQAALGAAFGTPIPLGGN